jgi:hypothetical protein
MDEMARALANAGIRGDRLANEQQTAIAFCDLW